MHKFRSLAHLIPYLFPSRQLVPIFLSSRPFCTSSTQLTPKTKSRIFTETEIDRIRHLYNLTALDDVRSLTEKYKKHKQKLVLNEEIVFFRSLVTALTSQGSSPAISLSHTVGSLIDKIRSSLQNSQEEYPLAGSLLSSCDALKLYQDSELWLILGDYVISGRIYASFGECLQALKGGLHIRTVGDYNYYNDFFSALESLITSEYSKRIIPLQDLVKISRNYMTLNRRENRDFLHLLNRSLQEHLVNAISDLENLTTADVHSLIEIVYCFSRLGEPLAESLGFLNDILETKLFSEGANKIQLDGSSFSHLVYSLGTEFINSHNEVRESMRAFIRDYSINAKVSYRLQHLGYLQQYALVLCPEIDQQSVSEALDQKVFSINSSGFNFLDMIDYLRTRVHRAEEDGHDESLPTAIANHLDSICAQNLGKSQSGDVYIFFEFIVDNGMNTVFKRFWKEFPDFFLSNLSSYDFEQWCMVYYVYIKEKAQERDPKIKEIMEVLNGYIYRFISAADLDHHAFPERIPINSNFFKVLEVADASAFYGA